MKIFKQAGAGFMTKSLCKKKRNWLNYFIMDVKVLLKKIILWWKWKRGRWKNYSVIGSGICLNNHGRRLRGTGEGAQSLRCPCLRPPNIWETRYTHFIYYDKPPRGLSLYFCTSGKVRFKWWNYFKIVIRNVFWVEMNILVDTVAK